MQRLPGQAGQLTLASYVVKTDLAGPEKKRIPAQLGRLLVPERRSDPDSQLIELAFVRIKSTVREPGPPLIFLAGGPGVSGTDGLRWERLSGWFQALRQSSDVVLLDQRGTGLSLPRLDCLERWELPVEQPGSREDTLRRMVERCRVSAAYWRQQGVDLSGYTTQESADDINDLRIALGAEQVSLYGASYGSHLALATLKRHEAHIARVIVALVEGPDHTLKLPATIQRHLIHLAELVQADPHLSRAIPDFLALMRGVLQQLEQKPVTVEVKDGITGQMVSVGISTFDLQMLTASGLGSRRFLAGLPARYHAMARGDFSWAASKILEQRRDWVGNAMTYMMDCASGASPERLARIQREVPETLLEDLINFPFPEINAAWDAPDLGADFREPVSTAVPTLFVSGTLDARTPISNAEEVRAGFSASHHIIIEGAAHATAELVEAEGVTEAMLAFLQGHSVQLERTTLPFAFTPVKTL